MSPRLPLLPLYTSSTRRLPNAMTTPTPKSLPLPPLQIPTFTIGIMSTTVAVKCSSGNQRKTIVDAKYQTGFHTKTLSTYLPSIFSPPLSWREGFFSFAGRATATSTAASASFTSNPSAPPPSPRRPPPLLPPPNRIQRHYAPTTDLILKPVPPPGHYGHTNISKAAPIRQSKDPCLIRLSGIAIPETENAFKVITPANRAKREVFLSSHRLYILAVISVTKTEYHCYVRSSFTLPSLWTTTLKLLSFPHSTTPTTENIPLLQIILQFKLPVVESR
ncbi:hypothetical protein BDN72DRAFT_904025 [Pluteus cervinus]|uniref:Uncharacterized protein n=1 Tax=Pluteus cervinus TaxID=181527 RepID=A0ACD3A9L7_9AGAR|nr:hypothetical protein BDN72DRAFT_904025 [Pluteus cervinus]